MNFLELYNEYLQEQKSDELAVKVSLLQKEALVAKDLEIYLKTTLLLMETLIFLQLFDEAIIVLQDALKTNMFEDYKVIVALTDKLIGLLLKTEDFQALESVLRYRERFIIDNPTQNVMQKFYQSVCYEGLKQYQEAIETLESIDDSISNSKLVSKYLKLAMLYQKKDRFVDARSAYDHALIFDKNKKNEIFYLVESDLLFAEMNYEESLKKFQEFFLKTTIKNRYLDRYIYINIALGNYEEAWKFYTEYNTKINLSVSKNYRYSFYQAGYALAKTMNKYEEAAVIKEKLLSVYNDNLIIIDAFDGIRALFSAAQKKNVFAKKRDIIMDGFRILASVVELPGLFFILPELGQVTIYTYRKGLLLEKTDSVVALSTTIFGKIIDNSHDYALFSTDELSILDPIGMDTVFNYDAVISVQSFKVTIDISSHGFIVAFLDKNLHFDYLNKLLYTTKAIMESRFSFFSQTNYAKSESKAMMDLFSQNQCGLAKIVNGNVILMNKRIKAILDTDNDTLSYESFQSRFPEESKLYIDRLITKEKWNFPIVSFQNQQKQLEIHVLTDDLIIYLVIEDVTSESEILSSLKNKAYHCFRYDLANMHQYSNDYQNIVSPSTIILIKMINADALADRYSHDDIIFIKKHAHASLRKAAIAKLVGLYLSEDGCLMAILSTSDKRVIERIFRVFQIECANYDQKQLPFSDIPTYRCGCLSLAKPKALEADLNSLYIALQATSTTENIVWFDKSMIVNENRKAAIAILIKTLLESGNIALVYRQVGNLDTRKVEMYHVDIRPDLIPCDQTMLQTVLSTAKMTVKLEMEKFKKMIQEIAGFLSETDVVVNFGIDLSDETLQEPSTIEDIVRVTKQKKVPFSRIVIIYNPYKQVIDLQSLEKLKYLKEKGFTIGGNINWCNFFSCSQLFGSLIDVAFCNYDYYQQIEREVLDFVNQNQISKLIVANVDTENQTNTITASKVYRIEGKIFPLPLSMDELILKLSK
ncbi:MAG: tetratricopeptide repeat protein [Candidatus Izemoplasmatales bacterium]|nr:tetratricopeptide repeat protein [Candidatus Izemoplasmatales bacterium]